MRKIRLTLLFVLAVLSAQAQRLKIDVQLDHVINKEIYLAHHYLGKIYVGDTIQLNDQGYGVFERDSLLHEGLYKVYMDENNHFDFILGSDQEFTISNNSFQAITANAKGALETERFFDYVRFVGNLRDKSTALQKEFKSVDESKKAEIRKELNELTGSLHDYWFNIADEMPESFLSKFLLSNYVPVLDIQQLNESIRKNDSLLLLERFRYQQTHFWDYFDYTDERFLYTPLYKPKLETWFTKVLFQNYDSIRGPVFEFIENVSSKKRIFQFVTSYFLNNSINSNVMGMDALFIDIAKAYYLSGEAFWASEESLEKIKENVLFIEPNLIGKTAPDLTLESVDGEYFNLHQIEKKRTCVLIYEPNCSHCKVFVPELYKDVYQKYKDKGLEVFAIYSMDDKEEWLEFLDKHQLWDWINVWDKEHSSRFKILYDARKTPGIYVLDENKTILAKKISVEQLRDLMERDLKRQL